LVLGVVSFGGFGVAKASDCDGNLGTVAINNPTSNDIHYLFRWGNGDWKRYTLSPGQSRYHWSEMKHGRAPVPEIKFDNARGHDRLYSLDFYRTSRDTVNEGRPYAFQYDDDGDRLDLVAQ
jgi:hypothetical protein